MAISLIASATAASTDSTPANCITTAIDTSTGAADFIILGINGYDYVNRYDSFSNHPLDSAGNTWTPLTLYADTGTGSAVKFFYCKAPTLSTSHTFTAGTGNSGVYCCIWVWALKGVNQTTPIANDTGTHGAAATSLQYPSSVGSSGQFAVAIVENDLDAGSSQSIDSSFTQSFTTGGAGKYGFVGGTHITGAGGHLALTGAVQPTWSSLGAGNSGIAIALAVVDPAGGGAVDTSKFFLMFQ